MLSLFLEAVSRAYADVKIAAAVDMIVYAECSNWLSIVCLPFYMYPS